MAEINCSRPARRMQTPLAELKRKKPWRETKPEREIQRERESRSYPVSYRVWFAMFCYVFKFVLPGKRSGAVITKLARHGAYQLVSRLLPGTHCQLKPQNQPTEQHDERKRVSRWRS